MVEKYFLESETMYPICVQYSIGKDQLIVGGHASLRNSIEDVLDSLVDFIDTPEIVVRQNKVRFIITMRYKAFRDLTKQMKELNYGLQWTAAFNRAM